MLHLMFEKAVTYEAYLNAVSKPNYGLAVMTGSFVLIFLTWKVFWFMLGFDHNLNPFLSNEDSFKITSQNRRSDSA